MKRIVLFSLIVLISACRNNKKETIDTKYLESIVGKWKMVDATGENIIKISKDSIFEIYSYQSKANILQKIISIDAQNIFLSSVGAVANKGLSSTIYNYSLKDNQLSLLDQSSKQKLEARSCLTGICDEQLDYFRLVDVKINLPFVKDIERTKQDIKETDIKLYLGKSKKDNSDILASLDKLWIQDKFVQPKNLPFALDAALSRLPDNVSKPKILIFADNNTSTGLVAEIMRQLDRYGTKKAYFIVRRMEDFKVDLDLSFIEVEVDAINIGKRSFVEWLRSSKIRLEDSK